MGILDAEVSEATVFNFLAHQFNQKGRALSTVKNYYYAIRDPLPARSNVNLYDSVMISKLFAGAYHLKPPKKTDHFPKWSLQNLLDYLNSDGFEPLERAGWDKVFRKTIILLLLATGRRCIEIAAITGHTDAKKSVISFEWFEGFLVKAQRDFDNWNPSPPVISALQAQDNRLCPVRALRRYIALSDQQDKSLWEGRMWPIGILKLSYLVKHTIIDSVKHIHPDILPIDLPSVGAYHLRKLAISLSWLYSKVGKKVILDKVGSKSFNTLFNYYIKYVESVKVPMCLPMGTLLPNAPKVRDIPCKKH